MRNTLAAILMVATVTWLGAQEPKFEVIPTDTVNYAGLWINNSKAIVLYLDTDGSYFKLTLGGSEEQKEIGQWSGAITISPRLGAVGNSLILEPDEGDAQELVLWPLSETLCDFHAGLICYKPHAILEPSPPECDADTDTEDCPPQPKKPEDDKPGEQE